MSLYQTVNGVDQNAERLYDILDLEEYEVDRYRDCYLSEDKYHIILLTRMGGGNRQDYQESFKSLRKHPCYEYDKDCQWDETYCEFYFRFPKEKTQKEKLLKKMDQLIKQIEKSLSNLESKV